MVCVAATVALALIAPGGTGAAVAALAVFVVGNVAFEMGMVFYNAFLPDIAPPGRIGRISGYGWGLGYAGGLVCMAVALVLLVREPPLLGVSTAEGFNIRATNLLVAGWFLLFSLPMFALVRDRRPPARVALRDAVHELAATFRHLRRYREVAKFLVARLIYNDGLVTIFAFGGIYAAGTFGMGFDEVLVFGIALNVAAGGGALLFGFIDDRIGGKRMVMISLVALSAGAVVAVLAPNKTWFWVAGMVIGVFVGPNQSASRSLMARFVPEDQRAEFFGFFAFSGKITSFAGPVFLGVATDLFDSQRAGVATVLIFFVAGGLLLLGVDERRGIAAARAREEDREEASAAPA